MAKKKDILFTYTEHTVGPTVALLKRLLAMFPSSQFETHLFKINTADKHPDYVFRNFVSKFQDNIYLHFNFDCLGFTFNAFDGSPFFNTTWTPCTTYLTVPAAQLDRELRREMNLNVTLLCMTKSEEAYIRSHYPHYEDVRTVANPLVSIQPLYSVLLSIANRYPLI